MFTTTSLHNKTKIPDLFVQKKKRINVTFSPFVSHTKIQNQRYQSHTNLEIKQKNQTRTHDKLVATPFLATELPQKKKTHTIISNLENVGRASLSPFRLTGRTVRCYFRTENINTTHFNTCTSCRRPETPQKITHLNSMN